MKIYPTLKLALSEIQRDVKKAPLLWVSRVQQRNNLSLKAHEILGYAYSILPGGIPRDVNDIMDLLVQTGHEIDDPVEMLKWLTYERADRLSGSTPKEPTEQYHPALKTTIEGNWPSYTYGERMYGALDTLYNILMDNEDSRRAMWSFWRTEDSLRAKSPTRVPCSMYYQAFIRTVNDKKQLEMVYNMRSSDFDTFFVTDVYFAHQFQIELARHLQVDVGNFIHMITSLHSFDVHDQEIY